MQVPGIFAFRLFGAILLITMMTLQACDLINPTDPVPAYVTVNEIVVDPVAGTGTTRQQLEEVWVYLDGNYIGTYSLPAKIPLIKSGTSDLELFSGIRVNGIRSIADFYPFLQSARFTTDLVPGETIELDMHTRYRSNAEIAYLEDFESAHRLTDDLDGNPDTEVVRFSDGAFEGTGSGRITLTDSANFIQVATLPLITLPTNGSPVYVELHYKNNIEFSIGLVGHAQGAQPAVAPVVILRPQDDWYKVYVDLSAALNASQLEAYQIVIIAAHNPQLDRSEVYLDNLKVVHIAQ